MGNNDNNNYKEMYDIVKRENENNKTKIQYLEKNIDNLIENYETLNKKIILLEKQLNNNDIINSNSDSSDNNISNINNNNNSKDLFNIVWNNIFIRKVIVNQLHLYKQHYRAVINNIEELRNLKFKEYISVLEYHSGEQFISGELPNGLLELIITKEYSYDINPNELPETLVSISILKYKGGPLKEGSLPNSLKKVSIGVYNYKLESNTLPSKIQELELPDYNAAELTCDLLPDSLQVLKLNSYNKPLVSSRVLPDNIQTLEMNSYNLPLGPNILPFAIRHLSLNRFESPVIVGAIPPLVQELTLGNINPKIIQVGSIPISTKYTNRYLPIGDFNFITGFNNNVHPLAHLTNYNNPFDG